MPRKPSDIDLGPFWHHDFREVSTLPEDRVVRVRFLANTCAGLILLTMLTSVGWQLFMSHSYSTQLRFWDKEIAQHSEEYDEFLLLLRDYMAESAKIEEAHKIIYSPMVASDLMIDIGRTLPDVMSIDVIEYSGDLVMIRGSVIAPTEHVSSVLSQYLKTLRTDPRIGPLFDDVYAPGFGRDERNGRYTFVIQLKFRGESPR